MSTDPRYSANLIIDKLIGATITGAAETEESFGIVARLENGNEVVIWIDQDAEGNGPGWITIEEPKHA